MQYEMRCHFTLFWHWFIISPTTALYTELDFVVSLDKTTFQSEVNETLLCLTGLPAGPGNPGGPGLPMTPCDERCECKYASVQWSIKLNGFTEWCFTTKTICYNKNSCLS